MRLSRRALLLGGVAGLAAWDLSSGISEHILRILAESFSPEVARTEGARVFAADVLGRLHEESPGEFLLERVFYRVRPIVFPDLLPQERKFADLIVTEFAMASNVLQMMAGAESEVVYFGLFSPLTAPCLNPLSASWAV